MRQRLNRLLVPLLAVILSAMLSACVVPSVADVTETQSAQPTAAAAQEARRVVLYSGRSESLVGPLVARFEQETGIKVETRWGETPQLAATLLEEGARSPADVFFAQDPGGLGAVAEMLAPLPQDVLDQVDSRFRDPQGRWVGVSGRARVVVYNTTRLQPEQLPADIADFTDPQWKGHLGWAPTNASFQTMVTAMRTVWGEERTRAWLEGMVANQPVAYSNNSAIVAAVGAGEIDLGFVNHYYLYRFLKEQGEQFPARNHFLSGGGPGSLVMVAGAGMLQSSANKETAEELLRFLLSPEAQQYFAEQTTEYPLAQGVSAPAALPALSELNAAEINQSDLADMQGTARLLRETGVLP